MMGKVSFLRTLVFSSVFIFGFSNRASADSMAVGTELCFFSCGGASYFIEPGQFLAQGFTLNTPTHVSSIIFTIGEFVVPIDPSNPIPNTYPNLSFDMQLTTAIGPETTASDVLASAAFTVASSGPQFSLLSFPLDQVLSAGSYYLIASTTTPIPNSSLLLGWSSARGYFPDTGPALGASGFAVRNSTIWEMMVPCSASDCDTNPSFPAASTFIPVSGPATPAPLQFQVCRGGDGHGCGLLTEVPAPSHGVPEANTILLVTLGLLVLFPRSFRLLSESDA